MQATGSLGGRPVGSDWHPCQGKKGRKKKENPLTGYGRIYSRSFLDNPHYLATGEADRKLPFLVLQVVGCGDNAPWLVFVRGFACRVK